MANFPLEYASPDLHPRGWLTRQLTGPLGWPTQVATAIVFFACLGASANYMLAFIITFVGVPMLMIWWLLRLLNWSLHRQAATREHARRWFALPVLAVLATALLWFDAPARGLFALHRGTLDSLAKAAAASPTPVTWTRSVGLYGTVTITQLEPGVAGVSVPGMGILRNDGFVYIASDVSPGPYWQHGWAEKRIAPCWFVWIRASF